MNDHQSGHTSARIATGQTDASKSEYFLERLSEKGWKEIAEGIYVSRGNRVIYWNSLLFRVIYGDKFTSMEKAQEYTATHHSTELYCGQDIDETLKKSKNDFASLLNQEEQSSSNGLNNASRVRKRPTSGKEKSEQNIANESEMEAEQLKPTGRGVGKDNTMDTAMGWCLIKPVLLQVFCCLLFDLYFLNDVSVIGRLQVST